MKKYLPFLIIAGVLVISLAVGTWMWRSAPPPAAPTPSTGRAISPPSPGAVPAHAKGEESAPVVIEEFGDFQCPPCGALEPMLKKLEGEYGSRLRIVFRHFPLPTIHQHAIEAARASEAAALQNRFWQMHDLLYQTQANWSKATNARPTFINYARDLGLDTERFARDLDTQQVNARIFSDQRRGMELGVNSTPTVFINNRPLPVNSFTDSGIRAAVDQAMGEKRR